MDIPVSIPTQNPVLEPTEIVVPSPKPAPVEIDTELPRNADADVTHVRAVQEADGSWTFHVTVIHPDTGWEDYADGWDVVTPDGVVLKNKSDHPYTRLLAHPHVEEQPFTRSQQGIIIPQNVTQVTVRAHDIIDGFGGQEIIVDLEEDSGEGFVVE